MVRVRHTWDEALADAEVTPERPRERYGRLTDFTRLDAYQADEISFDEYLAGLGEFLGGVSADDARRVHGHILWDEYPGSLSLIRELKAAGYRVGCLSNTNRSHIEELMESGRFPVCHAFDRLVTSYELGLNKPDVAIYRAYERVMGLEGTPVAFFDDAPANVEGAREAGWTAFLIDPDGDVDGQIRDGLREAGVEV